MIPPFINIIGFIAINILLAYVLKECILSVLPTTISALALVLFALCLIRRLSWIDYFFMIAMVGIILSVYLFRRKIDWLKLRAVILDPSNIIIVGILLFVYIIARNRTAADWDELGVWAIEVKTMFYADGLSLPYMHTSIGYANYIPGQMLIEWWFCHLCPFKFNDSLMFYGYYSIYYFMIAPLTVCGNTQNKWRNVGRGIVMIPILFVIPSCFCIHEYSMLSVELLISAVFCALLYNLFDIQSHTKAYTRIQWIALSTLLVMLKMDAFLFLVIVYLTAFILIYMDRRTAEYRQNESGRTMIRARENFNYGILALGLGLSAMITLIWQMAVRYYHRYGGFSTHNVLNNLKDILGNIRLGSVGLDEDKMQYIRSFQEAVLHQPLHVYTTNFFDLTVISCVILIMVILYLVYKNIGFRNGKREYIVVNCIAVGSILVFLPMLLFMYMYIFRETQYFNPATMIKSLSRYMEPLLMGWSLSGLLICLNSKKTKLGIIVLALFLMCPSYTYMYSYFNELQLNTEKTKELYSQGREEFGEFFQGNEDYFGTDGQGRILFVYGGNGTDLNIRQFRYLTAPRSVYWLNYDDTDNFYEEIYNAAIEDVCGFIYFEQVPDNVVQAFVDEYHLNPLNDYLYEIYE